MTRQFVENAVTMIVVYDDGRPDDFFSGYQLDSNADLDWDHIVNVYPSRIQLGPRKLQKLVNEFINQELTWEQYLDKLVENGELQNIPKTYCY